MRRSTWNHASRLELEQYLKDGYKISFISEKMNRSRPTILEEVKRGITEDEYKERRYNQYRAAKAHLSVMFEDVPTEDIADVLKEMKQEARNL